MGSGKTTVGQLLARQLNMRFIDTDADIELQQSHTCNEIITIQGEASFREIEHQLLQQLITTNLRDTIIATGGGMPCFNNNIELMKQHGIVIYLHWSAQDLATRLMLTDLSTRPLIKGFNKEQLTNHIDQSLNTRSAFYNQAHIIINAPLSALSPQNDKEIADKIMTYFA